MTIGVFFGGKSPEHDVSIITGELIISELKKISEHEVVPVYLSKAGEWHIGEELGALRFFEDENRGEKLAKLAGYFLDLEKSRDKIVFRQKGVLGKEIAIDMAFPAFHGMNGEDGTIQGLFEMFNIPYVGCGVAASAIAMDKILTKEFYKSQNIPTTKFLSFTNSDWQSDKKTVLSKINENLKYPIFVKPPKLGSSIGISRANNEKELEFGIEVALHYSETVLVEEGVENLADVTCAVLGNENPIPSLIQESSFTSDFFNYEEKYLRDGGAQTGNAEKSIIIPANLDETTTKLIQETAVKVYKFIGASGIARIDFLYNRKTNELFANEINPLPGTLYHHLWKASGIELNELVLKLVDYARVVHQKKNSIHYTFESDILKNANSMKLKK